ncbi:MAG TPA: hypothetical protein VE596_17515 [Gaiellaceae bacterium]|nr:hypothetical protein [Gaiellaceae bacterium]
MGVGAVSLIGPLAVGASDDVSLPCHSELVFVSYQALAGERHLRSNKDRSPTGQQSALSRLLRHPAQPATERRAHRQRAEEHERSCGLDEVAHLAEEQLDRLLDQAAPLLATACASAAA